MVKQQRNKNSMSSCKLPFPWKLYQLLEDAEDKGYDHVVSWSSDGRSFQVCKPQMFAETVMKEYFRQKHFKSFTRQLYIYGFCKSNMVPCSARDNNGEAGHCFSHPSFIRGNKASSLSLERNQGQDRRKSMDRRASLISASSASSASLPSKCASNTSLTTATAANAVMDTSASSSSTAANRCSPPLPASSSGYRIPGTIGVPRSATKEEGEHRMVVADKSISSSSALVTPAAHDVRSSTLLEPLCYKTYGAARGEQGRSLASTLHVFAKGLVDEKQQQQQPFAYRSAKDFESMSLLFEPRPIEQMVSEALSLANVNRIF